MQAIRQVDQDPTPRILSFLSKFDQKQQSLLDLASLVNWQGVQSITCHAACPLSEKDSRVDLMWSRYSLHSDTLYTTTGIPEVTNFQSNLDQNPTTVDSGNPQQLPQGSNLFQNSILAAICKHTPCPHYQTPSQQSDCHRQCPYQNPLQDDTSKDQDIHSTHG